MSVGDTRLLNCYVGPVPGYRNAAAVRAKSEKWQAFVSQARNFDVKIIKYRDTRVRRISRGIIGGPHRHRRWLENPIKRRDRCRGSDRSMGMQECERAGFFVSYGRLALRFFYELHNRRISSLIITEA